MKTITFFVRDKIDSNTAATIRLKHLISGFEANGYQTRVCSAHSTTRIGKLWAFLNLYFVALTLKGEGFVYGELSLPRFLGCFGFAKHVYAERTEFPFYKITRLRAFKVFLSKLYLKSLRGVDTFVTCSRTLQDFYQPFAPHSKVIVEPFFIDECFFDFNTKELLEKQICYCGYMGNNKDGVEDLLEAYAKLLATRDKGDFKLVLLGAAEESVMKKLQKKAEDLGIPQQVSFTGRVPHHEVLRTINQSGLLVLTRPDSLQAQGGFPSKLGEYLSTGNPVLCTDVGEIRQVVGDEFVNFVRPSDTDDIAHMMADILDNHSTYVSKAQVGKAFAKQFVPKEAVRRILQQKNV